MNADPGCRCRSCWSAQLATLSGGDSLAIESLLVGLVERAWRRGWQPIEMFRQIERTGTPLKQARRLIATAIMAQAISSSDCDASFGIDSRWSAQLASIERWSADDVSPTGWLAQCQGRKVGHDPHHLVLFVGLELMGLCELLMLIPPPGVSDEDVAKWSDLAGWGIDEAVTVDPLLDKVRALLAKAEATNFAAEAEAFTAKAHDLMARHSIEEASLRGRSRDHMSADIGAMRLVLNEPYAKQHGLLLARIASAASGRCVLHLRWALATVIGPRRELAGIARLHASLMVQAQGAFNEEARAAPPGSPVRSRGYRSAFLTAYAIRVGQRLDEQRQVVVADAPPDALPVLTSDRVAVQNVYDRLFGDSVKGISFDAGDSAGLSAGAGAADRARLFGDEVRNGTVKGVLTSGT